MANLVLFGIFTVFANGFRFFSNIIIFNRLDEVKFGSFGFQITTYVVLSLILSMGVETNYVRKAKNILPRSKTLFNYAFIIKMVQIIVTFPLFFVIFFLRNLSFLEFIIIFLSYCGRVYFNLFVAYYSTLNVRWKTGIGDITREGLLLFIIILMQIQDVQTYLILVAICEFFGLLILVIPSITSMKAIESEKSVSWKLLFESTLKLTVLQVLTYSNFYVCMFFLTTNELGIFVYANSFAGMLGILTSIIASTTFPHYASSMSFKTWKKSVQEIKFHSMTILVISIFILCGMILVPFLSPLDLILSNIGITKEIFIVMFILSIYYLLTSITAPIYRFSLVVGQDKELVVSSLIGIAIQIIFLIIFDKFAYWAGISLIFGISTYLALLWILTLVKRGKFSPIEQIPS